MIDRYTVSVNEVAKYSVFTVHYVRHVLQLSSNKGFAENVKLQRTVVHVRLKAGLLPQIGCKPRTQTTQ